MLEEAKRMTDALAEIETSADVQERGSFGVASAQILLAEGQRVQALLVAEAAFALRHALGTGTEPVKEAFALALAAAVELGRLEKADELLTLVERLPPGRRPQFLNATVARFRARLAAAAGHSDEADRLFKGAGGLFRELGMPFYLAATRLEHAEWLVSVGRGEDAHPQLAEATEIFTRLKAKPWLERLDLLPAGKPAAVPD